MKFGSESEPRDYPVKKMAPFRSLESTITRIPAHVASILMPLSETGSGYGINFDVTKEKFPLILIFFAFP